MKSGKVKLDSILAQNT